MQTAQRVVLAAAVWIATGFSTGCIHREIVAATPARSSTDPPSRVARLSYLKGTVSFNPAGTDDWVPGVLNRPLTTGDHLWTEPDARAELHIGSAGIRLSSQTSVGFLNLDDYTCQVKLSEGTIGVRIGRLDDEDTFEVDTPAAAISARGAGEYRFEVDPNDGQTGVIVRTGQVDVTAPGQTFTVGPGQQARIFAKEPVAYEIATAPRQDAFDGFCLERDLREQRAESLKYVSPYAIGWEDLDGYGSWRIHAAYGPIWIPRSVAPAWAPYRFGHWVWIEPWGWTWIDDAPWGFAPFHYGRWVFIEGGWCWIPGPLRTRAIYAPALVVFLGGGPGFHHFFRIGIGVGVAWFPLGPREVYIPPYRVSRTYVRNINVSNTVIHNTVSLHETNVARQRYMNRTVQGAVTAVPEDTFASGKPVSRSAAAVSPREAAGAHVGGMSPPVVPTRGSLSPISEAARSSPRPPDRALRRPVVVQRTPSPAPVPFEQRTPALESNPGRPPDSRTIDDLRRAHPERPPDYRQVRPPAGPAAQTRPPSAPGTESRRDRPGAERAVRQQETRKRAIERERHKAEPESRRGQKKD